MGYLCLKNLHRFFFFFSSSRRHTRSTRDWSSDVCSSDLAAPYQGRRRGQRLMLEADPDHAAGISRAWPIRRSRPADTCGMVRVSLQHHPLTASAALVWSGDLPRPLQQMLFETADSLTAPAPPTARRTGLLTTA